MTYAAGQLVARFYGSKPFYVRDNLDRALRVFDAWERFTPQTWGLESRQKRPYARGAILARLDGYTWQYTQYLNIARKDAVAYDETAFSLDWEPRLRLRFDPATPASDWRDIFRLADALAEATEPDYGVVHIPPPAKTGMPWSDLYSAFAGMATADKYYKQGGPFGLALRNYFGPYYVEAFGRDLLLSIPAPSVARVLPWGGIQIDLVPEPWNPPEDWFREIWHRAMAHLEPAKVFTVPVPDKRPLEFRPNVHSRPGRVIENPPKRPPPTPPEPGTPAFEYSRLRDSHFAKGSFEDRKVEEVNIDGYEREWAELDDIAVDTMSANGVKMPHLSVNNSHIVDADFEHADLRESEFKNSLLYSCSFEDSDLTGAKFTLTDLATSGFTRTRLAGASFAKATLTDTSFLEADLTGASFSEAKNESRVNFRRATLRGATFAKAKLEAPNFAEADLRDADFSKAKITGGSFRGAQLDGVKWEGARLERCEFDPGMAPVEATGTRGRGRA